MKYSFIILVFTLISTGSAQDDGFFIPTTTLGGYGELHYNMISAGTEPYSKTLDFHRFVLFFSHGWTENWSFKAELELEHNFVSDGEGELELEQATVNYHNGSYGFQAGVLLPSVGILNEHHEPPLFFSVERPDYAKIIIPTTWFGNGAAVYGKIAGFDMRLTMMEGLNGDGIDKKFADGVRGGRQKGYKSNAEKLLTSFRVNYANVPGLKLGASFSHNEAIFSDTVRGGIGVDLIEFHTQFNWNNIISTFEYGQILFDNHSVDKASGFYLDLGYNIAPLLNREGKLIPWVRYTALNPAGGHASEEAKKYSKIMAGITIKPIDDIAFKLDYGIKTFADDTKDQVNTINLGVGYQF